MGGRVDLPHRDVVGVGVQMVKDDSAPLGQRPLYVFRCNDCGSEWGFAQPFNIKVEGYCPMPYGIVGKRSDHDTDARLYAALGRLLRWVPVHNRKARALLAAVRERLLATKTRPFDVSDDKLRYTPGSTHKVNEEPVAFWAGERVPPVRVTGFGTDGQQTRGDRDRSAWGSAFTDRPFQNSRRYRWGGVDRDAAWVDKYFDKDGNPRNRS